MNEKKIFLSLRYTVKKLSLKDHSIPILQFCYNAIGLDEPNIFLHCAVYTSTVLLMLTTVLN